MEKITKVIKYVGLFCLALVSVLKEEEKEETKSKRKNPKKKS